MFDTLGSVYIVGIVAVFSLAWFVVGVVVGRELRDRAPRDTKRSEKKRNRRNRKKDDVEIYVGNLPYEITEKDLRKAFSAYGSLKSVRIIKNKFNNKSKGYGFIEMVDRKEATAAIASLNGKDFKGRKIVVNEAKSRSRSD